MGLFASPNRAAMMGAVSPERRGVASGVGVTLVNTGATFSLGLTLLIMSQVIPLSTLEAILTGNPAHGGPNVASEFLLAVHVVFLMSAILVSVALVLVLRRWRAQRAARLLDVVGVVKPG